MALSLKPDRIKRYKAVVALLIKYGRSDLVQQADLEMTGVGNPHPPDVCLHARG